MGVDGDVDVDASAGDAAALVDAALSAEAVAAGLAAVSWLPREVVARAATGAPGCVGVSRNGKLVLSIVPVEDTRLLLLADFTVENGGLDEKGWPLGADAAADTLAALSDESLALALKDKGVAVCSEVFGDDRFVIPKSVPVKVDLDYVTTKVSIEGNRPVKIDAVVDDPFQRTWNVVAAYYATDVGSVYLRREHKVGDGIVTGLVAINAPDLGQTLCVPRPVNGKPLVTTVPPAFDPAPPETSCVAMSADGTAAAFKVWSKSTREEEDDQPNTIVWFGPGAAPAIDLSCLARKCKPAEQAALSEAAAKLGVVGCAVAKGAIAVDGMLTPFVYSGNLIRFQGGSGYRTVYELSVPYAEEPLEKLWKVFQLPTGGPVYLYVGRESRYGNEVGVVVLDEAKLGLCAAAPAGTLKVVLAKASVAARDGGGYRYAAGQLIDGDPSTAWRAGVPKKGESASIELLLDGEHEVTGLEVGNGFQRKDGNGDLFAQYARAADLLITFADGSSEKASLAADERGLQRVTFPARRTRSVTLTVTGMHAGAKWPDDVALSEVRVIGK